MAEDQEFVGSMIIRRSFKEEVLLLLRPKIRGGGVSLFPPTL